MSSLTCSSHTDKSLIGTKLSFPLITGPVGDGEFITDDCANNVGHAGRFVAIYFGHPGTLSVYFIHGGY